MSKRIKILSVILAASLCLSIVASAVESKSASFTNYSQNGTFVPDSGTLYVTHGNNEADHDVMTSTILSFKYSTENVSNIVGYNNNAIDPMYAGIDIKSVPSNGTTGQMDAYAISTTLPNPKSECECNNDYGSANDEAEVVALGTIIAGKSYLMSVKWDDLRNGSTGGVFSVNAELSYTFVGLEYHVNDWRTLITLGYGANRGKA